MSRRVVLGELAFGGPRLDAWIGAALVRVADVERLGGGGAVGEGGVEGALAAAEAAGVTIDRDSRYGHVSMHGALDAAAMAHVAPALAGAWAAAAAMGAEGELFVIDEDARGEAFALHMGRPGPRLVALDAYARAELAKRIAAAG